MSSSMRTKLAGVALVTTVALGGGIAAAQIADAHEDRDARIQNQLDEGTITEEEAAERRERLAQRTERRAARHADREARHAAIAELLDTTTEDLHAELRAGTTMAELAGDAGVDIDVIIDQLVADITTRLDDAVAAGDIDQATADERLTATRDKITARVNGELPERDSRGRHGRGRGHGHGHGQHRGGN